MKHKKRKIINIVILIILVFGGYYIGNISVKNKVKALYTVAPESGYSYLISGDFYQLSDRAVLSYFMRGQLMGLGPFTTDEFLAQIENQDLKIFLKEHQNYLTLLMEKRNVLLEKNPELRQ